MTSKQQEETAVSLLYVTAYRRGYSDYTRGLKTEDCPLHTPDLRKAWAEGWTDAHDGDVNEKADEQADVALGD
jgi:ribosome modulation factor